MTTEDRLDRIETLLTNFVVESREQFRQVRSELREVRDDVQQVKEDVRLVKEDIQQVKEDVRRLEQRADSVDQSLGQIQRQLDGEIMSITQMVLNLGEQMQAYQAEQERFKLEVRTFMAQMQHMKGSFEAHMQRTNRILDFLMRQLGPDNVA